MTSPSDSTATPSTPAWVTVLLAFACGAIVANLYYSQPLIKLIAADTQMPLSAAGVLVTLSQIGYGLGLLLLVPLGDLVQARKLVAALMGLATVALVNAALADNATVFLASAFAIGLGSVAAQVLVPFAAQLAAPAQRGKAVGQVMSGLLFGILLARPLASLLSTTGHWQTVFWLSAVLMGGLALVLL
ncbi:MFS transporter [Azoarcus sp. TTM-91]|uniref:MFS transporter n=1 Tax=Azoarcus sp. TTM-91 TaxID=2691581 RepID=UPI001B7CE1A9|nr:MFS transporter [Azoarcus sp. TTM-91]